MDRDGNAHNLRVISGNGGAEARRDTPAFDALAFLQSVTATLDLGGVLERIQEQLRAQVQPSGWIFYTEGDSESWSGGKEDRHRIEYSLSFGGETMGSLILMRGRRFGDDEQEQIEALLGLAAPALHNAWRFHRLNACLETDELTGLGNRRAFDIQGERWLADCRRQERPLSIVAVDLDHFKQINDRFGHTVGDALLQRVADTLRAASRQSDLCIRMGGEEFLVLLPGADLSAAMECGERIRLAIANIRISARAGEDAVLDSQGMVRVTASVGVTSIGRSTGLRDAYQAADEALYAAKQAGRNRVLAGA